MTSPFVAVRLTASNATRKIEHDFYCIPVTAWTKAVFLARGFFPEYVYAKYAPLIEVKIIATGETIVHYQMTPEDSGDMYDCEEYDIKSLSRRPKRSREKV